MSTGVLIAVFILLFLAMLLLASLRNVLTGRGLYLYWKEVRHEL